MIEERRGRIEYDEHGTGPAIVLVPGSCSTGAAWRPIMNCWNGRFRCITTSLLGYGGTAERRTPQDSAIEYEAEVLESVILEAGEPVHLAGHSFGGLVSLAVALRRKAPLASLVIIEAPAAELLRDKAECDHYQVFRNMTAAYFADFDAGKKEAIATMIDFYGGHGTFASWPRKLRAYAIATTAVNILDWASAFGFPLLAAELAGIDIPVLVLRGSASPQAVRRANELISICTANGSLCTVDGASHFMIATHAREVSQLVAHHVESLSVQA